MDYNPENRRPEDRVGKKVYRYMIPDEEHNRVLFYWRQSRAIDPGHRYASVTYAVECVEWLANGIYVETLSIPMTIYYNSPEQLDALLHKHGLETVARYGGYNGESLTVESRSQVVIACKAE